MRPIKKYAAAVAAVSALGMTAACGSDDTGTADTETKTSESPSMADTPSDSSAMDPAADLVGPGCADYAKAVPDGAGSVAGMAQDPVAVAASNNPVLKTLVAAVSGELNPKVDLVDTLNGDEFTVFAPVDSAFAKIPAGTVKTLQKDPELLTTILTYHVVPGRAMSKDVAGMTSAKTVNGKEVHLAAKDGKVMVDKATVTKADVGASNGVIHVIDTVLMP